MISVCHTTVGLGMGGIEQLLVDLAARSDRTRFSHTVCCLVQGGPREEQLTQLGVPVHHLHGGTASDPRTLFRLARLLRRLRPDILHVHCPLHSTWAVPAALLGGVGGIVCTVHSTYWHRGVKLHLAQALGLCQRRWVSRTVAISEAVADYVRREKCALPDRIVVVHNGVDLSRFDPARARPRLRRELGLDQHAPIVAAVGGLRAEKGHAYLLEAFGEIRKREADAHLVLIGEGALRRHLEESARAAGLRDAVHFLGRRQDVEHDVSDCDVLVMPSVTEGFGLALVEAMALGVPIVASHLPGIAEVVGDEGAAVLVPPRDSTAIAAATCRLLADPEARRGMGRVGRARAQQFSIEQTVAGIEAVYLELAERRAGPARGHS